MKSNLIERMLHSINRNKRIFRKILPRAFYLQGVSIWRKVISPIIHKEYFLKLKKFKKKFYKNLTIQGNNFNLLISPKNGYVDEIIFTKGILEEKITNRILSDIKKEDIFLDIGSNIGYFPNLCANLCKEVIAFEPVKDIYIQNKSSIENNGYKNIKLYNYACGAKNENKQLNICHTNVGGSSLIKEKLKIEGNSITEKQIVRVVKLDEFLPRNKKIDFVKIDVEGFEYEVLKGMKQLLLKNKPKIIMEFSPYIYEAIEKGLSKKIIFFLEDLGYEIYNIDTDKKFDISQIDLKSDHTDIYCKINKS